MAVTADDRFWLAIPMFFSFSACNETITALSRGATLVIQEQFDPERALELVRQEECTIMYGMANMFRQIESATDDLAGRLELVRLGMMIAPRKLRERFEEEHGIDRVLTGYGLTEVSAICTLVDIEASRDQRLETEGIPLANVDVRIKDPDGNGEVQPGKHGEICVRSRSMFSEYYKMPDKTSEVMDDGYLRTGDIGFLDEAGCLVFKGRMKDMIKTGGINVSPLEVENLLEEHPAIADTAVIGLPDEEQDEIVAAVVKLEEGEDLTEQKIVEFCEDRIASYKAPTKVFIREVDLPRTSTGKIRKGELEDEISEKRGS